MSNAKPLSKSDYKNYITELSSGLRYGVFVDDTGSPGLKTRNLHPERKSWVGVVIHPNLMPEVLEQLPEAIKLLEQLTGAKEFHYVDIYSKKGKFKNLDLQFRLALFKFMAYIFSKYRFPVFVQTLDPKSLNNIRSRGGFPDKVGVFNLKRQNDMALLFLLIRIKNFIEKDRRDCSTTARLFVDEGYKNENVGISIPAWKSTFADGLICFARSSTIYPIQLADFAAYSLNRTQLILEKEKLTDLDIELLKILSPIAWNYKNIEKREIRYKVGS